MPQSHCVWVTGERITRRIDKGMLRSNSHSRRWLLLLVLMQANVRRQVEEQESLEASLKSFSAAGGMGRVIGGLARIRLPGIHSCPFLLAPHVEMCVRLVLALHVHLCLLTRPEGCRHSHTVCVSEG